MDTAARDVLRAWEDDEAHGADVEGELKRWMEHDADPHLAPPSGSEEDASHHSSTHCTDPVQCVLLWETSSSLPRCVALAFFVHNLQAVNWPSIGRIGRQLVVK